MSSATKRTLTPEEYLTLERAASLRSEYLRGETFAMAGASYEHTLVKDNLAREAGNHLKNGPCRVLTSDMRVKVSPTGLYTYPDIVIVCDEPEFEDAMLDTLLNPRVIIEVLSDSTEKYDRGAKFAHYRQITSLQEYVLIAHDRPVVERYVRQGNESWLLTVTSDLSRIFEFASVPVRIALEEIFAGVQLPENPGR